MYLLRLLCHNLDFSAFRQSHIGRQNHNAVLNFSLITHNKPKVPRKEP